MKTPSKDLLSLLLILVAFGCSIEPNEENVDKLSLISDQEILDFKLAVIKQTEAINVDNFEKYKKFNTYEEFVANSTLQQQKAMLEDLNIKPIDDLALITKVYNLEFSRTDFDWLTKRINEMPIAYSSGKVNNCYSFCFELKNEVYWNEFWRAQESGSNMYQAHSVATAAAGWAYNGCMQGCAYVEPPDDGN